MATELLATKIRIPPEPHHQLRRTPLVDALERDVALYKILCVSAPAGYGKTTLLAQWARTSHFPVAWLSISEDDNDPERFLRYLVTAWAAVQPHIRESEVSLRLGAMAPDINAVLSAFINVGTEIYETTVSVIDDAHLIVDTAIHQAVTFLIDHLPPTLHFVFAGRGAPPLPLARYRARGELVEYGAEDLRFGVDETREFLNGMMDLALREDDVVTLHTQVEGWAAGLQLIALSLRRIRETSRPVAISGRHRFIADYMYEDVLVSLPEDVRQFLLLTSILERLNSALCDAVTGSQGSQVMLEMLEKENLFILPLDENREWYRYHRLFADVLCLELLRHRSDEVSELHHRAARWYLDHDLPEIAFHHAMSADDDELGFEILDQYMNEFLNTGQFRILQRWLDALPTTWRDKHPLFGLAEAGLLLMSGAAEEGVHRIEDVERRLLSLPSDGTPWQLARVSAVRCFVACFQNDMAAAESYADRALQGLADDDYSFRADILQALGDTYRRNGRWDEAHDAYMSVLHLAGGRALQYRAAHVYGALADLELMHGHVRRAFDNWNRALAAVQQRENWDLLPLPVLGWVELRLGEILYEWNELEEAQAHLERGLERAELGGDVQALLAGSVIGARLKLTEGNITGAAEHLERARAHLEPVVFPHWTSRFERCEVDLWLAQGKLRSAVHWADTMLTDDALEERPDSEPARLALAWVLILRGDASSLDQVSSVLDRLLEAAEHEGRVGVHIEALALQALVHQQLKNPVAAMMALESALRLAEPEGYVRLFADLGLPMAQLLQEARARHVMPDYVAQLLAACGADVAFPGAGTGPLPELLSQRGQDVLRLIAAGLTNREIADTLYISAETVKKHTSSIYGKLGVGSRTEAITRSRELDLLN